MLLKMVEGRLKIIASRLTDLYSSTFSNVKPI